MLRREENAAGAVDADDVVLRRVEDEQRLVQLGDVRGEILLGDVVEEGAADAERAARERHLDLALRGDVGDAVAEQAGDVRRIARRADRHHGARLGDAVRGGEHRGAAEAVADQDRGRVQRAAQMIRRGNEIVDIRRERGVGELALAGAEAGEIEAQHGDAVHLQAVGDAARRPVVLAAGEAVREQRHRARLAVRPVEQRRELLALGVGKIETFGRHRRLLRGVCGSHVDIVRAD